MAKRTKTPTTASKPPQVSNLEEAQSVIDSLWQRLEQLEARLNKNSRNSSKPPSSDGPEVPPRQKPKSGKSRGAQKGHQGNRREQAELRPQDTIQSHQPAAQCHCGGAVAMNQKPFRRHQVFELPDTAYLMTEHRLYQGQCAQCGQTHKAQLPEQVSSTQMGPNLLAYIAIQAGQFHQSISKIQQQLQQNFGLYFSRGAISDAQWRMSSMLTPAHEAIRQQVRSASFCHADETSHQRNAERRWMWLATTDKAAYFRTHHSRGQGAAKILLGDTPSQVVISDRYAGYNFIAPAKRQLCWAHILRDVEAIAQSRGRNQVAGQRLTRVTYLLFRIRHRWEQGQLSDNRYRQKMQRLRRRWQRALEYGAEHCTIPLHRNRCRLLLKQEPMCWTFLDSAGVPLTNNEAERCLRGYVLWRKGSYGVWSHRGEQFRQRLLSAVETAKKLGHCPLNWLRDIAKACIEKSAYPLLPELIVPA